MSRHVYIRGLGLLGQYGTLRPIAGSKTFVRVPAFTAEPIDRIAASYFGNACTTVRGALYYWGWQFCPMSSFRLLMLYNEGSLLSRAINKFYKGKNMVATPRMLFDFKEPIKKVALGNGYVMALSKAGNLFGLGANNSVTWEWNVGSTGRCRCSEVRSYMHQSSKHSLYRYVCGNGSCIDDCQGRVGIWTRRQHEAPARRRRSL
eukprot:TRINITY_DN12265_c0_g3_i2.p1 TRINITY_DN12265_c0_g3~~TRINITY_DN12265_c0_g3_i2.p1  ORF type:complete len:204 (-),score=21.85 TRINITY_DN12265_c0_g3_i2:772-1383(-)